MGHQDGGPAHGYSVRRLSDDELAPLRGIIRCTMTKACPRLVTIVVVYAAQSPTTGAGLSEHWFRCDEHGQQMADAYGVTVGPAPAPGPDPEPDTDIRISTELALRYEAADVNGVPGTAEKSAPSSPTPRPPGA